MQRRISTTKAINASKIFIAKDPEKDFESKMAKLIKLMLKNGFKDRQKEKDEVADGLLFYDLTLCGEMANVIVTRNESGFGSKNPLKIYIYMPVYDDTCENWEDYYSAICKINKFVEEVKKIDGLFLQ